jgi:hypothetical protein
LAFIVCMPPLIQAPIYYFYPEQCYKLMQLIKKRVITFSNQDYITV